MNLLYGIALVLALGLLAYLAYALMNPEKF